MPQTPYEFTDDWFSMRIPVFEERVGPLAGTPCKLLEIGAYEGRATTWLADNVLTHPDAHLDSIEPQSRDALRRNIINRTGRASQVTLHEDMSRHVLRRLPLGAYDFIYVDGSHATFDVLEDAVSAFQLAKLGGIIAFDDYAWDESPRNWYGVPRLAIDAFLTVYAHPPRFAPQVEVIEIDWQVWVRKLIDERPVYF
jgi:predicted O-methyltransferase YrrM